VKEDAVTGEQPTDRYLLAVEAQRTATENLARVMVDGLARGERAITVRAVYEDTLEPLRKDPETYTAVLVRPRSRSAGPGVRTPGLERLLLARGPR
jgi:hypothetical protein